MRLPATGMLSPLGISGFAVAELGLVLLGVGLRPFLLPRQRTSPVFLKAGQPVVQPVCEPDVPLDPVPTIRLPIRPVFLRRHPIHERPVFIA
jgi:hypothetical protein